MNRPADAVDARDAAPQAAQDAAPYAAVRDAPPPATASDGAPQTETQSEPESRPPILTLVLVRHGRSTSNASGTLAGRTPGVDLDDEGRTQADALRQRLTGARIDRLISSPMQRCLQTMAPLVQLTGLPLEVDERFAEVDYGRWTGLGLKELASEPLWRTVQQHPSAAVFPGGEGLAEVSARAAAGVRAIRSSAAGDLTVLLCSHGDVIKAIVADALGLHLDAFQRIVVAPGSVSVVRYTPLRPFVERVNDTGDLRLIAQPPVPAAGSDHQQSASDAVPGGIAR